MFQGCFYSARQTDSLGEPEWNSNACLWSCKASFHGAAPLSPPENPPPTRLVATPAARSATPAGPGPPARSAKSSGIDRRPPSAGPHGGLIPPCAMAPLESLVPLARPTKMARPADIHHASERPGRGTPEELGHGGMDTHKVSERGTVAFNGEPNGISSATRGFHPLPRSRPRSRSQRPATGPAGNLRPNLLLPGRAPQHTNRSVCPAHHDLW